MNILDENDELFVQTATYTNNDRERLNRMAPYVDVQNVRIINCHKVKANCRICIGRKYNTSNGCPVCGEPVGRPENDNTLIYVCSKCGSVIETCGFGDVNAVGVGPAYGLYIEKDDVI